MEGTMRLHLLPMMVHRLYRRPRRGLLMPAEWRLELAQEGFEVIDETIADRNCGIHAFAIALIDATESEKILASTSQFRQVRSLSGKCEGVDSAPSSLCFQVDESQR